MITKNNNFTNHKYILGIASTKYRDQDQDRKVSFK